MEAPSATLTLRGLDRAAPDGEGPGIPMQELVNLRLDRGALRPVGGKHLVAESLNAMLQVPHTIFKSSLYVHHAADGSEVWVAATSGPIAYAVVEGEAVKSAGRIEIGGSHVDGQLSFYSLGNILCINDNTSKTTRFALWSSGAYALQPELPDAAPVIFFMDNDGAKREEVKTGALKVNFETELNAEGYYTAKSLDTDNIRLQLQGATLKKRSELHADGYTDGYVFACTAIKLIDGSYVRYSSPVAMYAGNVESIPPEKVGPYYSASTEYGGNGIFVYLLNHHTYVADDPPLGYVRNVVFKRFGVSISAAQLMEQKLVESICIFMTKPTCMDYADLLKKSGDDYLVFPGRFIWGYNEPVGYLPEQLPSEMFGKEASFYKVLEIPRSELSEATESRYISVDFNDIATLPTLPVDSYTAHRYHSAVNK
jgi:hypothetical protein